MPERKGPPPYIRTCVLKARKPKNMYQINLIIYSTFAMIPSCIARFINYQSKYQSPTTPSSGTIPLPGLNTTANLTLWPPIPWKYTLDKDSDVYQIFTYYHEAPTDLNVAIQTGLHHLALEIKSEGTNSDPMEFYGKTCGAIEFDLFPLKSFPPISRQMFALILGAVEHIMDQRGVRLFVSRISSGGLEVAVFILSLPRSSKHLTRID